MSDSDFLTGLAAGAGAALLVGGGALALAWRNRLLRVAGGTPPGLGPPPVLQVGGKAPGAPPTPPPANTDAASFATALAEARRGADMCTAAVLEGGLQTALVSLSYGNHHKGRAEAFGEHLGGASAVQVQEVANSLGAAQARVVVRWRERALL